MYNNTYISRWVYFAGGLDLVLQQPSTAVLAKIKTDIVKRSALIATHLVDHKPYFFQHCKSYGHKILETHFTSYV